MKLALARIALPLAATSTVGAALFLHIGPACGCLGPESEMAEQAGRPLENGAAHARERVLQAVPRGSPIAAVRRFVGFGHEPLDADIAARHAYGELDPSQLPDDFTARLRARRNHDRLCVETPAQVACRFDTERHLLGSSGFDLVFVLDPDRRVRDVRVDVHSWWQPAPAPLSSGGDAVAARPRRAD